MHLLVVIFLMSLIGDSFGTMTMSPVRRTSSASDEYTISFKTPNISLENDNVYLCLAARLPDGLEDSYMVNIVPEPDVDAYAHIVVVTCDEIGFGDSTDSKAGDEELVWDCGSLYLDSGLIPPLVRGSECTTRSRGPFANFVSQWQSGPAEEDALELPDGMGIPVRGTEGRPKYLIANFHYPSMRQTKHNSTGVNGLQVTLVANPPEIKLANNLILHAAGFVSGQSVETVTATWTLDQEIPIQPQLIYVHWHTPAITDVQVWREKKSGDKNLILRQDPRKFSGVSRVEDPSSAELQPGDKLCVSCTFNNTSPHVMAIFVEREMCVSNIVYSVEGNKTLDTVIAYSADPRFVHCLESVEHELYPGEEFNDEGHSQFPGNLSDADCFRLGHE